jgi:hypothetical protein
MAVRLNSDGSHELIQVMSTKEGHREEMYDPTDKKQVDKIKKLIREKMKEGYYLYAYDKDSGNFITLQNEKDITEDNLDRFLLTKKLKKKLVTKPIVGG